MKKYVFCGVSHRAVVLYRETPEICRNNWELAGLWDIDPLRFEVFKQAYPRESDVPVFLGSDQFEAMLDRINPDLLIVCPRDHAHAEYVIRSLRKNINVAVEKPMAIDSEQARQILLAEKESQAKVIVTFNYRYANRHRKIKELLDSDLIGRVVSVEANIYVDELHGSSYFRRWNRDRDQSGGLSIHKEGHYLDLLRWWLNQKPVEVFAFGGLNFYGDKGELNPSSKDGRHCAECEEIGQCPYIQARKIKRPSDQHIEGIVSYQSGGRQSVTNYTNYRPDRCVFDSDIEIEDTYSAVIRFEHGTQVAFAVNFSSPFEQNRFVFNGTRGRLEFGYTFASGSLYNGKALIAHYPLFEAGAHEIPVENSAGNHGGADPSLLSALLGDSDSQDGMKANSKDGALAVAAGEAMWKSVKSGKPILIKDLLGEWY